MKLKNRDKENTELLITTGFVLVVIGFSVLLRVSAIHLIISGIVIVGIGAFRFLRKSGGKFK